MRPTDLTADLDLTVAQLEVDPGRPILPNYDLLDPIGRGAFGEIWRARQMSTNKEVAVKLFHGATRGMVREVERLAGVGEHPHVVTLLDADVEFSPPYLVLPLLAGSLGSRMRELLARGPRLKMPSEKSATWMVEVSKALAFIHRRGIVHGDLKPDNVLLDSEGRAKLADFGQAQAFGEGALLGTLFYMPVEQVQAALATSAQPQITWDVYALGATFYYLFSGLQPRSSERARAALIAETDSTRRLQLYMRILRKSPLIPLRHLNPEVSPRQALIVERCLELKPERRYSQAQTIVEDLELIRRHPDHWLDSVAYAWKCGWALRVKS